MKITRTQKEIDKKIKELCSRDYFCDDNYGSEAADNGEYELYFSEHNCEQTLKDFVRWLQVK